MSDRKDLTEAEWGRLSALLPSQKGKRGRPRLDDRTVINGILWIARTGAPWRDLPERYGSWKTVSSRFYRWQASGVWQRVWEGVQAEREAFGEIDWEVHFVDGTVIRAHQDAGGAKRLGRQIELDSRQAEWYSCTYYSDHEASRHDGATAAAGGEGLDHA